MEMMVQPSLSDSICFANPPDQAKDDHFCERIPVIENWMMHPNSGKNIISMNVEISRTDNLSSLTLPRSISQISTTSCASKFSALKYVYRRMKPQHQYLIASSCQTSISKDSCGFSSAVNSETNSLTAREDSPFPEFQLDVGVRNIDNCSSSKLNLDVSANPVSIINKDDLLEMENPSVDMSEKAFCISFLQNHGLQMHGHIKARDVGKPTSGISCSRFCKICCRSESTLNLLICDDCDNAFHAWCCHPRVNDIPTDEWFCNPCIKKKQKLLKEKKLLKLQKLAEGAAGNKRVEIEISAGNLSCLDIMLLDDEPHKTEVRVGKGFQADVPEWSGPRRSDSDIDGEALETAISESERLHNPGLQNPCRVSPIGNWLQCREVVSGIRKDIDGTVCGKWRRAPLSEVQSDDWDCFSAVFWNPAHADCAAPQEVGTEEVLKQLKYIQMLKTRLTAKRQKLSHPRSRALRGPYKDAGNQ